MLARDYRPVADDDYLPDPSVCAMMGPEAIRKALQWALRDRVTLFHIHTHGGRGIRNSAASIFAKTQSSSRTSSRSPHNVRMARWC